MPSSAGSDEKRRGSGRSIAALAVVVLVVVAATLIGRPIWKAKRTEQAYEGSRARKELLQILQNQLDSLTSGGVFPVDAGLANGVGDQIARVNDGGQDFPWEDGLPPAIAASIEPYAQPLAQLYCEGIAKIELMQKNKGLNLKN